ncbi:hypothetical protein NW762_014665 [Fusarium torreyae]|uniref:Uncharacterized protein n=1 Tax=Fusarium torreyae TaxID=1237075 RepID=A0A9W8RIG1_9HYPO|nr:hypothetical protein NW762_014665 [Fusarium torreyae]
MTKASGKYKDMKFETWGPQDTTDCDDYTFEVSEKPSGKKSRAYQSEHVFEWQSLKGFLEYIGDLGKDDTVGESPYVGWNIKNPAVGIAAGKVKASKEIEFCDYMWLWWENLRFEYKGWEMSAVDHLRLAIPNNDFYTDELQLLWSGANTVKQSLWQRNVKYQIRAEDTMESYLAGKVEGKRRYDVNDAINVLRDLMFAVRYMKAPSVKRVMFTQADRIYKRLNEFEEMFVKKGKIADHNKDVYVKLDLGTEWQKWCKQSYVVANTKQKAFLEKWITRIKTEYLGDEEDESAGGAESSGSEDGESSGDESGGSDAGSGGGTELNEKIRERVQALVDAYEEYKKTPWTDPFNWD